jgi:hypothetical protein
MFHSRVVDCRVRNCVTVLLLPLVGVTVCYCLLHCGKDRTELFSDSMTSYDNYFIGLVVLHESMALPMWPTISTLPHGDL